MATVVGATALGTDWRERGRFAMAALLRFLAERPDIAHMGVVEVMAAGPAALAERDRAVLALKLGDWRAGPERRRGACPRCSGDRSPERSSS